MVIQNGTAGTSISNNGASSIQNQAAGSVVQNQATTQSRADRVHLSSASSLVALAKGMMPADKQAKVQAVSAQFNSGQYKADSAGTSRGMVQDHLQS
jgi:anti-sigma28 factor (negative regulator of flagellin synthesis)